MELQCSSAPGGDVESISLIIAVTTGGGEGSSGWLSFIPFWQCFADTHRRGEATPGPQVGGLLRCVVCNNGHFSPTVLVDGTFSGEAQPRTGLVAEAGSAVQRGSSELW